MASVFISTVSAGIENKNSKKNEKASMLKMQELGGKVDWVADKGVQIVFDTDAKAKEFERHARSLGFVTDLDRF